MRAAQHPVDMHGTADISSKTSTRTVIRTPDQRLRVFVSSTLQELAPEREAAARAIRRLRLAPVMFELGARPHAPRALYRAYLDQSDVFIGIYWQRYGWIAPGEDVSGLEDEFRLAGNRPKLIYVKTPAPEREPALRALLDRVRADDHTSYKAFSTLAQLRRLIEDDLALLLSERFAAQPAPAPAPAVAPDGVPTSASVPASTSSFVGREQEIKTLRQMLRRPEIQRLVTITGPGGVGKTRLAIEVARGLSRSFAGGIYFVLLANVDDPRLVLETIAQQVGAPAHEGRLPLQRLRDRLDGGSTLLVLDNLEQVVGAASYLAELLAACPRLSILATSRTALQIRPETDFVVRPLPTDNADTPDKSAAVELFLQRARAVNPGFGTDPAEVAAVIAICRRLDGLPLAIELAAARAQVLSAEAILARLDNALQLLTHGPGDLPDRQKTLRGTLDWSFQLLEDVERTLFSRLSVFAGGWTLEAAEAVCSRDDDLDVLDTLTALVGRSLVQRERNGRFSMLTTIREYAAERLSASGDAQRIAKGHARYILQFVENAATHLRGEEQQAWRRRLSVERDNIRVALRFLLDAGELELASRMQVGLLMFWWIQGYAAEARQWADELLGHVDDVQTLVAARARLSGGLAAAWEGDYQPAIPLLERSLAQFREIGDARGAGVAQMALAYVLPDTADKEAMLLESAADLYQSGDLWAVNVALQSRADVALADGHADRARELYQDGLQLAQSQSDGRGAAQALIGLGFVDLSIGDVLAATCRFECSVELTLTLANAELLAYALRGLAGVAHAHGHERRAARLLGAAQALGEAAGAVDWPARRSLYARFEAEIRGGLGARQFGQAWESGHALSMEEAAEFGLASQSSATAAVRDCGSDPKGSDAYGSKYSPNSAPGVASRASLADRSHSATSRRPCWWGPHHTSQLKTSHAGPHQYARG